MNALPQDERDALRQAILAKHSTVYAFWKAHTGRIGKSVVFLVLRGDYPGNQTRQAKRIRELLSSGDDQAQTGPRVPTEEEILAALQRIGCARCPRSRRKNRSQCKACHALWGAQARELRREFGPEREEWQR